MKHPAREEWIPFIFGESDPIARQELGRHLDECPECARAVAGWRGSLLQLDRWSLPKPNNILPFVPALKWAMAAALTIGLGFLIGRITTLPSTAGMTELRTAVEASVRASLQEELRQTLQQLHTETSNHLNLVETRLGTASTLENRKLGQELLEVLNAARTEDARGLQAALRKLEEQHHSELVAVRTDLETLASMTDEELRQARWKLVQLAANNHSSE